MNDVDHLLARLLGIILRNSAGRCGHLQVPPHIIAVLHGRSGILVLRRELRLLGLLLLIAALSDILHATENMSVPVVHLLVLVIGRANVGLLLEHLSLPLPGAIFWPTAAIITVVRLPLVTMVAAPISVVVRRAVARPALVPIVAVVAAATLTLVSSMPPLVDLWILAEALFATVTPLGVVRAILNIIWVLSLQICEPLPYTAHIVTAVVVSLRALVFEMHAGADEALHFPDIVAFRAHTPLLGAAVVAARTVVARA